jgi:hypothetical protein
MDYVSCVWESIANFFSIYIVTFLNSSFAIALLASMAGAYFGATAAQKVILRSKKEQDLESELRNINSAIMCSFTICNMGLTIKKQLVKPLYDKYILEQGNFNDFEARRKAGKLGENEVFHYEADLQDFDAPPFPLESLNNTLFNKVSVNSRALSAAAFLEASYSGLKSMLDKRRGLIEMFKNNAFASEEFSYYYFGLKMESGNTQKEYSDAVNAIMSYTDDVIFFSKVISEDVEEYGKSLKEREKLISSDFSIRHADFSLPEEQGLMPVQESYSPWLEGFKD